MRALLQRVSRAVVTIDGEVVGCIDKGLLIYLGVMTGDTDADLAYLVDKIRFIRIFPDDDGKMNRDVIEASGAALAISAFSLCADARKGRRPSFDAAARPEISQPMYDAFCQQLRSTGLHVENGRFGAMMDVDAVNDGPIFVLLDSQKQF